MHGQRRYHFSLPIYSYIFFWVDTIAQERSWRISSNLINYHRSVLSEIERRHGVEFHYMWRKRAVEGEVVRV